MRLHSCTVAVALCLAASACSERRRSVTSDGQLAIAPADVDFRLVALHARRSATVELRNVGRSSVNVLELFIEGAPGYSATLISPPDGHVAPGATCQVRVDFAPGQEGPTEGHVVARTDARLQPLLKVPLKGIGVDARATFDEAPLDFGRIEVGTRKRLSLKLVNRSPLEVRVTPRFTGPDADEFSFGELRVPAGEDRTAEVAFHPTRVSVKKAALAIAPCEGCPERQLALTAEGLDQAVVADPPIVNFGQVPVDRAATLRAGVKNISTEPMRLLGLRLEAGADASFSFTPATFPVTLGPGERREYPVRYGPTHMGPAQATLGVEVDSARRPVTTVRLAGFGGSPELCVSPVTFDFGEQPVGARASTLVTLRNCGAPNGAPLEVQGIELEAGATHFHAEPVALPRQLSAGEAVTFRVFFEPTSPGSFVGALEIRSSAFGAAAMLAHFSGRAKTHAPCEVRVTPGALDYGTLVPGRGAVLGVRLTNVGVDLCALKNLTLPRDGGGVFRLPSRVVDAIVLEPGQQYTFLVAAVVPPEGGAFEGLLRIEEANPAVPFLEVPLSARARRSCLVATPIYLDFDLVRPGCPGRPLATQLSNQCAAPVTLTSIAIGDGTTPGEFRVFSAPGVPRLLLPGQTESVEVEYLAGTVGTNVSPLYLGASDLEVPLMIPLLGEHSTRSELTEEFVQQDGSQVDVLFVVDNTQSMAEESPKLLEALPAFAQEALAQGVDLHVAVTTTGIEPSSSACPGGALGGEAGRLFPADGSAPRLLTHATEGLAGALQRNASVGLCAQVEQGFEAMRRALTSPLVDSADDPRTALPRDGNAGFLRDAAGLAVVFVGDEDDHSPDDVDTYVRFLRSKKGLGQPQRATVYALAPAGNDCGTAGGSGARYLEATQRTGGELLSICAPDYRPLLREVARKAFGPAERFPLANPAEGAGLSVWVNGQEQTGGWRYEESSNSVVFSQIPPPGARISVRYRKACGP